MLLRWWVRESKAKGRTCIRVKNVHFLWTKKQHIYIPCEYVYEEVKGKRDDWMRSRSIVVQRNNFISRVLFRLNTRMLFEKGKKNVLDRCFKHKWIANCVGFSNYFKFNSFDKYQMKQTHIQMYINLLIFFSSTVLHKKTEVKKKKVQSDNAPVNQRSNRY